MARSRFLLDEERLEELQVLAQQAKMMEKLHHLHHRMELGPHPLFEAFVNSWLEVACWLTGLGGNL